MSNEKNKFLTVSWLSGLLSAEIFISTGEWGVQMPPLTSENSHFLRSGPQEATLVMENVWKNSSLIKESNYETYSWCFGMESPKYPWFLLVFFFTGCAARQSENCW